MTKSVLITVGSTKFDNLIAQLAGISKALSKQGYDRLVVQHGKSPLPKELPGNVKEAFNYVDNLSEYINQSDLVISHGGTGTIIETLRSQKKLIAINNDSLAEDHQRELIRKLAELGYCIDSNVETLIDTINSNSIDEFTPVRFPEFNAERVRRFIHCEAGIPL
ncbi:hypothetical protein E3Q18_02002 [Wallemia mellicola]|uniref:UDP-N-acetylglucosamine transferase subunit ALG13 n=1 Tax=Wallemia mellicola TaxID=1708541 RepID=A0AB38MXB2_9BASI|nr:hypothetical protein E3Q18_02002 [Wallemia mellicola]TIC65747.1 hypothetical protein E3Q02_02072 [Wallemia mellicola]TIC67037.1 hypothetical protein E3Q03_02050 [Wallemia mellicola]